MRDKHLRDKDRAHFSFIDALEQVFYEAKPILYFTFAILILRSDHAVQLWIKYASFGILVFSLYVIYRRLDYRGII